MATRQEEAPELKHQPESGHHGCHCQRPAVADGEGREAEEMCLEVEQSMYIVVYQHLGRFGPDIRIRYSNGNLKSSLLAIVSRKGALKMETKIGRQIFTTEFRISGLGWVMLSTSG